ncbi:MAG: hypothetical protein FWG59_02445 [Betaproteobacteria bacterium]|nr:hypothetical protein [Betaproteobacteria bacterium]
MELLYLVPVAGLCLLGGGFIYLLRSRKRIGLHPVVRELLNQAIDQRSIMLVEFTGLDTAGGRFFGPCVKFDEHTLLIDVSLPKALPAWTNRTVSVNFDINYKGISSYYQYMSQLRELPRLAGGYGMLLDTPAEILSNQKRSFVRVAPLKEVTFGIGIWPLDPAQERPSDPAALGVAQLSYRLDHPEQMSLLNVSAAGLCLELRHPQGEQPPIDLQPGDRLLCLLMLRSQEGERTLPFWLDCTVVNRAEKGTRPDIVVGLNFNAWAAPRQGKAVDWFTVGEDGAVGPLAAWVLQQQLAQLA